MRLFFIMAIKWLYKKCHGSSLDSLLVTWLLVYVRKELYWHIRKKPPAAHESDFMLSTNRKFPSDRVLVLRSLINIIPDPVLHPGTVIRSFFVMRLFCILATKEVSILMRLFCRILQMVIKCVYASNVIVFSMITKVCSFNAIILQNDYRWLQNFHSYNPNFWHFAYLKYIHFIYGNWYGGVQNWYGGARLWGRTL
jgi:hypothetical protein